ncbi:hypothetical protein EYF80_042765 [Liparis tanakae]|uniref:Uncharacterized protein n=1 Tax=Liparis tanakae TaxID=230148 RepID=A0A4Z2G3B4_9TELE|nr:hypothetical protein EYF80_042765 [Liparis tanakae]
MRHEARPSRQEKAVGKSSAGKSLKDLTVRSRLARVGGSTPTEERFYIPLDPFHSRPKWPPGTGGTEPSGHRAEDHPVNASTCGPLRPAPPVFLDHFLDPSWTPPGPLLDPLTDPSQTPSQTPPGPLTDPSQIPHRPPHRPLLDTLTDPSWTPHRPLTGPSSTPSQIPPEGHPLNGQQGLLLLGLKLRATSYKLRSTRYELRATSYEVRATSYKLRSTRYELRATSYELRATSYEVRLGLTGSAPRTLHESPLSGPLLRGSAGPERGGTGDTFNSDTRPVRSQEVRRYWPLRPRNGHRGIGRFCEVLKEDEDPGETDSSLRRIRRFILSTRQGEEGHKDKNIKSAVGYVRETGDRGHVSQTSVVLL